MKVDTKTLLSSVDLGAVLAADLGPSNRSGTWCCPFHEDKSPSFGLVKGKPGLWHCFGCGKSGDAIDFLRHRHGLSFRDACERLAAGQALPIGISGTPARRRRPSVRQSVPPSATWATKAATMADEAAAALWVPAGILGLEYLRSRGLTDETIRAFRLGWIAKDRYEPSAAWGLPEDHAQIWTPAGICIPWFIEGKCWRLNVRRLDPEADPKYKGPAGFRQGLFNADALTPGRAAVLVEGEFDALAILQSAGDIVVPVATGSTSGARVARWLYELAAVPAVLVAFDADANAAGDLAAPWWLSKLPNSRRWRPTGAKDPGAMHPEALRAWIAAGLGITEHRQGKEVPPIGMTRKQVAEPLPPLPAGTVTTAETTATIEVCFICGTPRDMPNSHDNGTCLPGHCKRCWYQGGRAISSYQRAP